MGSNLQQPPVVTFSCDGKTSPVAISATSFAVTPFTSSNSPDPDRTARENDWSQVYVMDTATGVDLKFSLGPEATAALRALIEYPWGE